MVKTADITADNFEGFVFVCMRVAVHFELYSHTIANVNYV